VKNPAISLSPKLHAFGWRAYRQRGISAAKVAPGWLGSFGLLILWGALLAISLPAWGKDYETVTFRAPHLDGRDVPLNVILPKGYDGSEGRYPVLYLLHGYTVHYSSWVLHSGITQYARHYQEIIVMPEAGDCWYVNNYANPKLKWQDYFIYDVIPYVDRHFRTVATRNARALAGTSMGGYGALLLGLKYHTLFTAAASLSGVVSSAEPSFEQFVTDEVAKRIIENDFGPFDNPGRDENDLFRLVREIPASQMPQLYLSIGTSDKYLGTNRDFVRLLSTLKIPFRYNELPGGHEWGVWDPELKRVLALQAPVIGAMPAGKP
jgi:S-formylglutathione hydrolase FrmB